MIKHFCDCCGKELTENNEWRTPVLKLKKHRGQNFEFSLEVTGIPEDTEVCRYCIMDASAKIDDRPKVRPSAHND